LTNRLAQAHKQTTCIEAAVTKAAVNVLSGEARSFAIYGEPQSGKTEMMICLTAKLLDNGFNVIIHLLNDSVQLLQQNLDRFQRSGLAPAAKNFSDFLDPSINLSSGQHVIFCKKNGKDLDRLCDKTRSVKDIVVIDDEADYATPNAKINKGEVTLRAERHLDRVSEDFDAMQHPIARIRGESYVFRSHDWISFFNFVWGVIEEAFTRPCGSRPCPRRHP
jgi:hypothetical protein